MTKWHEWTLEEDEQMRQMHSARRPWREICEVLGVSVNQAQARAAVLKIKRKKPDVKLVTTSVVQPPELLKAFKRLSRARGISFSRHIRQLMIRELKSKQVKLDYESFED